jgi:hypothetical protein
MMTEAHGSGGRTPAVLAVLGAWLIAAGGALVEGQAPASKGPGPAWQTLFDGKTLANWQSTKFSGEGLVKVEGGTIVLEAGRPMSGVTWTGPKLPVTNYEIALEAMRVEGRDFFAGITFPVADSFCSLILGGWGGTTVGLSSIGGMDASENETSQSMEFEMGRWYAVRIRVTPAKIQTWLDDKPIIDVDLKDRSIDIRIEMESSKPLGIAAYRTKAALRNIRLRPVP